MKLTLKFRVWGDSESTCQVVDINGLAQLDPAPCPEQVEQFTGLLDKYNQEIYTGDILRCRDEYGDFYHQPVEFSIRWSLGGAESDDAGFLLIPHNREVVGNMRQTPELCQEEESIL